MKLCRLIDGIAGRFSAEFDGVEVRRREVIVVRVLSSVTWTLFSPITTRGAVLGGTCLAKKQAKLRCTLDFNYKQKLGFSPVGEKRTFLTKKGKTQLEIEIGASSILEQGPPIGQELSIE